MPDNDAVTVKELMIDIFEYPHIPYWFTIKQVIGVIRKSLINTEKCVHPRVVLVFDEQYNLIGLVTLREILQGLDPKLKATEINNAGIGPIDDASLPAFEKDIFSEGAKRLMDKPLSDVMTPIRIFLSPEDSVIKAALLMLHNNLIVLPVLENKKKFVGVIRMPEVFEAIFAKVLQAE